MHGRGWKRRYRFNAGWNIEYVLLAGSEAALSHITCRGTGPRWGVGEGLWGTQGFGSHLPLLLQRCQLRGITPQSAAAWPILHHFTCQRSISGGGVCQCVYAGQYRDKCTWGKTWQEGVFWNMISDMNSFRHSTATKCVWLDGVNNYP